MSSILTYDEKVAKYKSIIKFENVSAGTAYGGPATPANHMGMLMKDYITDTKKGFQAYIDYIKLVDNEAPIDFLNTPYPGMMHVILTTMWLAKVKIPGRELPDDDLWQIDEKPVIDRETYDFIIENGFEAFREMVLPKVIDMEEVKQFMQYISEEGPQQSKAFIENGFPLVSEIATAPPFEILSGARSMPKFFMDCYKIADKIKEAQDVMLPKVIENSINMLTNANAIGAWVGGWRGASGLVSPKIWDKLVWPYMKEMALAMLDKGFIPVFHLDQNWDRDIERFLEMPAKSCVLNTDGMTDLRRARKLLGDHVAFMGDVPAPLLSTASADKVSDYVKKLIDDVGIKGTIITSGCDAPANAKFENMVAMIKTAAEYK
ncbi:uroporphyrinogen decarboxylase family protein [Alkalibacter mobilis]|uniref:uroporphyrinogen decarboxylase family protein n=1 Tax=Alkalibacter mobilis TaxID=2787712 RepID=UPI00189FD63E|nr:uroporphyrinogen decarboxylase family protein [Alkalibacter mobilis]MBF7097247.1 methyltransferase [Alkalibacter mobilis]